MGREGRGASDFRELWDPCAFLDHDLDTPRRLSQWSLEKALKEEGKKLRSTRVAGSCGEEKGEKYNTLSEGTF